MFAEWQTLGKVALSKGLSAAVLKLTAVSLCRGPALGKEASLPSAKHLALGKEGLYRVSSLYTRQIIFLFFLILATKLFVVSSYTM
jgi:hypothetical protein